MLLASQSSSKLRGPLNYRDPYTKALRTPIFKFLGPKTGLCTVLWLVSRTGY